MARSDRTLVGVVIEMSDRIQPLCSQGHVCHTPGGEMYERSLVEIFLAYGVRKGTSGDDPICWQDLSEGGHTVA